MMRLPYFRYHAPASVSEAAAILDGEGEDALVIAGGTDVLPNMKRRQQVPRALVSLRRISELKRVQNGRGLTLGAGLTLTEIVRNPLVKERYAGLWQAAAQVATPHLRNMGTLGGNICLDTRCTYYDQSYEWRKAIDFCMKKDGDTCWVAPGSSRCLAVSSTDTAPALIALGAKVRLVSTRGERTVDLADLYVNDGIHYATRRADELLTEVLLPSAGWRSAYWKLRRRGSFDFPVLGAAVAAKLAPDGTVEDAHVVLGAVASRPQIAAAASVLLRGRKLTDAVIEEAAAAAAQVAKPMDNTDFLLQWRKRMAAGFVRYALSEVRGDDMSRVRRRIARHDIGAAELGP